MTFLLPARASMDLSAPLAELSEHGFARLGRTLSDEGITALGQRADAIMLGRGADPARFFFQHDSPSGLYEDLQHGRGYVGPSLAYRKIEKLENDPLFRSWIENALFERVARALHPGPITLYRAVLFNKAPRGGTVLPWHQDNGSFWGLDQDPLVQIWTALDDAPVASGCLEIVPGSHEAGLATPLGGMVPANVSHAARAEERRVFVPARAGESILIHNDVWHRSGTNTTDLPRRGFTICYLRGETRCMRTRRAPRRFVTVFGP
jgi:hypothetical protein